MVRDAEYFHAKLGSIEGADDTGNYIVQLVKGKQVPKVEPPAPSEKDASMNGTDSVGLEKSGEPEVEDVKAEGGK